MHRGGLFVGWPFSSSGLFARRAPALSSPRRRGFLPADRHDTDFGRRLELGRNCGHRARLLVDEALALVVPEDHFVVIHLLQVLGQEWHLAAAARGVDNKLRNREAGCPAAQRLHDPVSYTHLTLPTI